MLAAAIGLLAIRSAVMVLYALIHALETASAQASLPSLD
jgi:hypothetical protein